MRTEQEIIDRIAALEGQDFFGWQRGDLLEYLSFEAACPFLKDEAKADDWPSPTSPMRESILAAMLNYMPFAWGKANDCRGISADRSVGHMTAWCWMLGGEDAAFAECFAEWYECYGKPVLARICERFGWDWAQWDDGNWTSYESEPGLTQEAACAEYALSGGAKDPQ